MDIVSIEFHLKKNNYSKSPIGTINRGQPNNSLHKTYFRRHLNQE
jgi:hypothetical protein